jgi:hypothetical protein
LKILGGSGAEAAAIVCTAAAGAVEARAGATIGVDFALYIPRIFRT